MKTNPTAKLTALTPRGETVIVEVPHGATFGDFYHYYTQQGRRYSTKRLARVGNRNEGIDNYRLAPYTRPGLELIAAKYEQSGFTKIKIVILRKRAYKKLIEGDPAGMVKINKTWISQPRARAILRYPVRIPSGHTTTARKWSILTSRKVTE